MDQAVELARFKFVAEISKMGDNKVIWIPKRFQEEVDQKFGKKQVRITIDDDI
jgi:ribosomal protein L19E